MDIAKTKHFLEYEHTPELQNIYESGRVLRYHANPWMSIFGQTDADHQWGCAALLFKLHPNPSIQLIKAAIFHDAGERWAGDMPYPAKIAAPEVAEAHGVVEHQMAADAGVPTYHLSDNEQLWLKFADRLESHFFTLVNRPEIVKTIGFAAQEELIKKQALELRVWSQVKDCFQEFKPETKESILEWVKKELASNLKMLFGGSASTTTSTAALTEWSSIREKRSGTS